MSRITFYNDEAEEALRKYLGLFNTLDKNGKLFPVSETYFRKKCKAFERKTGIRITPQILRKCLPARWEGWEFLTDTLMLSAVESQEAS